MTDDNTALATTTEMVNPITAALADAERLGSAMAKCNMMGCKTVEQGTILALTCITERITPLQFMETYDMIPSKNGTRPCMKAGAMMAKLRANGGDFNIKVSTTESCTIEFLWPVNGKIKKSEYTYTFAEAKAAKLTDKDNWKTNPKDMLLNRCTSKGLRAFVPELFAGHYLGDEIDDVPAPPPQSENVETVAPTGGDILPPPNPPNTPQPPEGGGGLDADGTIKDPPCGADLVAALKDNGVSLSLALGFIADVPHWIDRAEVKGTPIEQCFNALAPQHCENIITRMDEFKESVVKYADAKGKSSVSNGADSVEAEPPPDSGGEPAAEPVTPDEVQAPPAKRKRGRPRKSALAEGAASAGSGGK